MAGEAARGLLVSNHSYGYVRGWIDLGDWYWFGDTPSARRRLSLRILLRDAALLDELLHARPATSPSSPRATIANDFPPAPCRTTSGCEGPGLEAELEAPR